MDRTKVAIWGSAGSAKIMYDELSKKPEVYEVICFVDNDAKRVGEKLLGLRIIGFEEAMGLEDEVYFVVYASAFKQEIVAQLYANGIDRIIDDRRDVVDDYSYSTVVIEISGTCNAKCKWCATGIKNRDKQVKYKSKHMTLDEFKKVLDYLDQNHLVKEDSRILLYNWGEPFLNPHIEEILEYLALKNKIFSLSTNASICKTFDKPNLFSNLQDIVFSLSGFTQEKYSEIHGFELDKIKKNIEVMCKNIKANGYKGKCKLAYHIYQDNQKELEAVRAFADQIGAEVDAYYAYFAGLGMGLSYFNKMMDEARYNEAKHELVLDYVEDYIKSNAAQYKCIQEDILVIDQFSNIDLCCVAGPDVEGYVIGSLFEMSASDIWRIKKQAMNGKTCRECKKAGMHFWLHNPKKYEEKEELLNVRS